MSDRTASGGDLPWNEDEIRELRARILGFFDEARRPLPWRDSPDPYPVLVSEVMSQQTRLESVVPYYRRWMERFPDPASLADAQLDDVLALWQGLGYYSRARNLHRAAREIQVRYGGRIPGEPDELRSLPGVGPYTAGAVASIAFGFPTPAVDGNARRVLARLTDDARPRDARLRTWAEALLDRARPGDFNQALMELGSVVCTPRSPSCERCPVSDRCRARAAGTQEERPAPRRRGDVPRFEHGVAVLVAADGRERDREPRFLLQKRPARGLLGGLWEFPGERMGEKDTPVQAAGKAARILEAGPSGSDPARPVHLPVVDHVFSHMRVRYHPFLFPVGTADEVVDGGDARWVTPAEARELALPAAQQRILGGAREYLAGP